MIDGVENGINEVKSKVYDSGEKLSQEVNQVNFSSMESREDVNFDVYRALTTRQENLTTCLTNITILLTESCTWNTT